MSSSLLPLPSLTGSFGVDSLINNLKIEGNEFFNKKQYEESIKKYTEAIQLDPDNATIHANRAAAYSKLAQYEPAISDALKAIELDPKYAKGYLRLAIAYQGLKRYHAAIAQYKLCLEHNPIDILKRFVLKQVKKCSLRVTDQKHSGIKRQISEMNNDLPKPKKRRRLSSPTVSSSDNDRRSINENSAPQPYIFSFEDDYFVSVHCHLCEEHFEDHQEYKNHLKSHYDEDLDLEWKLCDFGCVDDDGEPLVVKRDDGFTAHIATHTDEKPFKCKVKGCSMAYSRKRNLRRHWRNCHDPVKK